MYSDREKNRQSCLIVTMSGKETTIVNPADNQTKKFKFDYSYWSHDDYVVHRNGYYAPKDGTDYADQVSRNLSENEFLAKSVVCTVIQFWLVPRLDSVGELFHCQTWWHKWYRFSTCVVPHAAFAGSVTLFLQFRAQTYTVSLMFLTQCHFCSFLLPACNVCLGNNW